MSTIRRSSKKPTTPNIPGTKKSYYMKNYTNSRTNKENEEQYTTNLQE